MTTRRTEASGRGWQLNKDEPFTAVPNGLLEGLYAARLSGRQFRVVLYLLRRQFGFHTDRIHDRQAVIARKTRLSRQRVSKILHELHRCRLVVIHVGDKRRASYEFQTDARRWEIAREREFHPPRELVTRSGDRLVAQNDDKKAVSLSPQWVQPSYKEKDLKKEEKKGNPSLASSSVFLNEKNGEEVRQVMNRILKRQNSEDKTRIKELSAQRNLIARSGLYSIEELLLLKEKSLEELRLIHDVKKEFSQARILQ